MLLFRILMACTCVTFLGCPSTRTQTPALDYRGATERRIADDKYEVMTIYERGGGAYRSTTFVSNAADGKLISSYRAEGLEPRAPIAAICSDGRVTPSEWNQLRTLVEISSASPVIVIAQDSWDDVWKLVPLRDGSILATKLETKSLRPENENWDLPAYYMD